ncbi:hypothetical protein DIPPA_04580 [Diplonema papillatum]|nr:hypothetical protein DIPPA_04580 [Diplonema papillatum]
MRPFADARPLWMEGVISVDFEVETLPLLYASKRDFDVYYETLSEKHTRKRSEFADMKRLCVAARDHRDKGEAVKALELLSLSLDVRKAVFQPGDYQLVAAQHHLCFAAVHLASYALVKQEASVSYELFAVAKQSIEQHLPLSERPLFLLILFNNWANYWNRRMKFNSLSLSCTLAAQALHRVVSHLPADTRDSVNIRILQLFVQSREATSNLLAKKTALAHHLLAKLHHDARDLPEQWTAAAGHQPAGEKPQHPVNLLKITLHAAPRDPGSLSVPAAQLVLCLSTAFSHHHSPWPLVPAARVLLAYNHALALATALKTNASETMLAAAAAQFEAYDRRVPGNLHWKQQILAAYRQCTEEKLAGKRFKRVEHYAGDENGLQAYFWKAYRGKCGGSRPADEASRGDGGAKADDSHTLAVLASCFEGGLTFREAMQAHGDLACCLGSERGKGDATTASGGRHTPCTDTDGPGGSDPASSALNDTIGAPAAKAVGGSARVVNLDSNARDNSRSGSTCDNEHPADHTGRPCTRREAALHRVLGIQLPSAPCNSPSSHADRPHDNTRGRPGGGLKVAHLASAHLRTSPSDEPYGALPGEYQHFHAKHKLAPLDRAALQPLPNENSRKRTPPALSPLASQAAHRDHGAAHRRNVLHGTQLYSQPAARLKRARPAKYRHTGGNGGLLLSPIRASEGARRAVGDEGSLSAGALDEADRRELELDCLLTDALEEVRGDPGTADEPGAESETDGNDSSRVQGTCQADSDTLADGQSAAAVPEAECDPASAEEQDTTQSNPPATPSHRSEGDRSATVDQPNSDADQHMQEQDADKVGPAKDDEPARPPGSETVVAPSDHAAGPSSRQDAKETPACETPSPRLYTDDQRSKPSQGAPSEPGGGEEDARTGSCTSGERSSGLPKSDAEGTAGGAHGMDTGEEDAASKGPADKKLDMSASASGVLSAWWGNTTVAGKPKKSTKLNSAAHSSKPVKELPPDALFHATVHKLYQTDPSIRHCMKQGKAVSNKDVAYQPKSLVSHCRSATERQVRLRALFPLMDRHTDTYRMVIRELAANQRLLTARAKEKRLRCMVEVAKKGRLAMKLFRPAAPPAQQTEGKPGSPKPAENPPSGPVNPEWYFAAVFAAAAVVTNAACANRIGD